MLVVPLWVALSVVLPLELVRRWVARRLLVMVLLRLEGRAQQAAVHH